MQVGSCIHPQVSQPFPAPPEALPRVPWLPYLKESRALLPMEL